MDQKYYVYILASDRNGTLYIGVTSDLVRRVYEHREGLHPDSFSAKYDVKMLVHYEIYDDPENAIHREKRLKKWKRLWKIGLFETENPDWEDLYPSLL